MLGNPERPKSPIEKRNFMFEILFSSFDHDDEKRMTIRRRVMPMMMRRRRMAKMDCLGRQVWF